MSRTLSFPDLLLAALDRALRTVAARPVASAPDPGASAQDDELSTSERRQSAALMRVNHVGEVCAQALYDAQALAARDPELRSLFERASREEAEHLAWTQGRIEELGGRTSLLNPVWYGGAFAIGILASRAGDPVSLGFMAETERQVEQHLDGHLERMPDGDRRSRAIVQRMKDDEIKHAESALIHGASSLPLPARWAMRLAAKVMTTTAHHI